MTKAGVERRAISVALGSQDHISCFADFFSEKWKTEEAGRLKKNEYFLMYRFHIELFRDTFPYKMARLLLTH